MARMPRLKVENNEAWYHIHNHAAARQGEYPLDGERCKSKLTSLISFYSKAYFCRVAGFNVMGNHYHLVIHFEAPRPLSDQEKWDRALMLYSGDEDRLNRWHEDDWDRFEKRLFNVSEIMRNIQGSFATWYNQTFDRKGRFWGDRFRSTILTDLEAVVQCLMYVDLNPVRAGLIERPEEWNGSSLYLRELGGRRSDWLMPLEDILGHGRESEYKHYKSRVYYRGAVPTKEGQVAISWDLLKLEQSRGFERPGTLRSRKRFFTRGVVVGDQESVAPYLWHMRSRGFYRRRSGPVSIDGSPHFSLRKQRAIAPPLN